jgi:hypothetical protein
MACWELSDGVVRLTLNDWGFIAAKQGWTFISSQKSSARGKNLNDVSPNLGR